MWFPLVLRDDLTRRSPSLTPRASTCSTYINKTLGFRFCFVVQIPDMAKTTSVDKKDKKRKDVSRYANICSLKTRRGTEMITKLSPLEMQIFDKRKPISSYLYTTVDTHTHTKEGLRRGSTVPYSLLGFMFAQDAWKMRGFDNDEKRIAPQLSSLFQSIGFEFYSNGLIHFQTYAHRSIWFNVIFYIEINCLSLDFFFPILH